MVTVFFKRLDEAEEFLANRLDSKEFNAIANQCLKRSQDEENCITGASLSNEYRLAAVRALADRHAQRDLRDRYTDRTFPLDSTNYKLGGHASELGHVHVDFLLSDGHWALQEIWICR